MFFSFFLPFLCGVRTLEQLDDSNCKQKLDDAGTFWCVDIDTSRRSSMAIAPKEVVVEVEQGGKTEIRINLMDLAFDTSPHGVSLFIQAIPMNAFGKDVDQLFVATEQSRRNPLATRFVKTGKMDVDLSPFEVEQGVYYATFENHMGRDATVRFLIHVDRPIEKTTDLAFDVQGDGDKMFYYFFNVSGDTVPRVIDITVKSPVGKIAEACGNQADFVQQRVCEEELLSTAVSDFYGTQYPMCLAHQELSRGIARDCWRAAVEVGNQALAGTLHNLYEAYAMCTEDLCDDGCRHGVLEQWVNHHATDKNFVSKMQTICDELGDLEESCFSGLGAGLYSYQADAYLNMDEDPQKALRDTQKDCETLVDKVAFGVDKEQRSLWCVQGASRHYIYRETATLAEEEYRKKITTVCDPAVLQDTPAVLDCRRAIGVSAAFRGRGDRQASYAYCDLLMDTPELQKTSRGGRVICRDAVDERLDETRLFMEKKQSCDTGNLFSTLIANFGQDDSVKHMLEWKDGYMRIRDKVVVEGAGLWWLAIDANGARELLVTVHSIDPDLADSSDSSDASDMLMDDLTSQHDSKLDMVARKVTDSINDVYAIVGALFVGMKLLLLVWLHKKLDGYDISSRV